ncbi:MAG: ATP synthase F0 subunit C [Deferribacteraceae bacterium]|jgi:F-type H+-transporting ATPase subunit c|nr:ATP synthase F0 subunit C [Deferribacteraceae bacterium]
MKKTLTVVLSSLLAVLLSNIAYAQQAVDVKQGESAWGVFLGAGLSIGIAACGTGIGMGHAINAALNGISRNPSVAPRIMTVMILGLALIESLAIYALVVSILLLFVI